MRGWASFFVLVGIISLIIGIIIKFLWFAGLLTFLPFGIMVISYVVLANSMFLLAIAVGVIGLLGKRE